MNALRSTRYSLGIFCDGEEVDGLTMYGFWPGELIVPAKLELGGLRDIDVKFSRLGGKTWSVGVWDVKIKTWPNADSWPVFINTSRHDLLRLGALVSWCSVEGSFVDPPSLFDPQFMSASVWVACTSDGWQVGPPALDAPLDFLTDEQLRRLHRLTSQYADK